MRLQISYQFADSTVTVQEDYVNDGFHTEGVDGLTGGNPESGFRVYRTFSEEPMAACLTCASDGYPGADIPATVLIEDRVGCPLCFGLFCHEKTRRVRASRK